VGLNSERAQEPPFVTRQGPSVMTAARPYPVILRPNGETPGAIDEAPLRELIIWKASISRRRGKSFRKIESEPRVSSEHNGPGTVHVAIAIIVFDGNKSLMKLATGSVAFRERWLDNDPSRKNQCTRLSRFARSGREDQPVCFVCPISLEPIAACLGPPVAPRGRSSVDREATLHR
jgi:hypothetical protein